MRTDNLFLRKINSFVLWLLPGFIYVQIARWVIPVLDPRRRDFYSKVRSHGCGYIVNTRGGSIYFYSPYNVGRYLFTNPELDIKKRMMSKYLGSDLELPAGGVVIDVGANVGEFSLAVVAQGGCVYACEPDLGPYACLEKNMAGLEGGRCFNLAFGEKKGYLPFYVSSQHNDSSFIKPATGVEKVEEIEVCTIDEFCTREEIKNISILKVEAEGYEPEILRGAAWALSNIVSQVAVDGGPERNGQTTIDECEEVLQEKGFETSRDGTLLYGSKVV